MTTSRVTKHQVNLKSVYLCRYLSLTNEPKMIANCYTTLILSSIIKFYLLNQEAYKIFLPLPITSMKTQPPIPPSITSMELLFPSVTSMEPFGSLLITSIEPPPPSYNID